MKKCYVYVIDSVYWGKRYKGMTFDVEKRLKEHNQGKMKSTKSYRPWQLAYVEEFENTEEARKRETYFKTAAGRRFLIDKIGPVVQRIE